MMGKMKGVKADRVGEMEEGRSGLPELIQVRFEKHLRTLTNNRIWDKKN
jgi:hypothetical protein